MRAIIFIPLILLNGCAVDVVRPEASGDLSQLTIRDLCASYAPSRNPAIRAELITRNEFTADEWKRIERGQKKPEGMREAVLWCAWGLPGDHGEIAQTVSGSTRYRYSQPGIDSWDIIVTNGVVTSWKPR